MREFPPGQEPKKTAATCSRQKRQPQMKVKSSVPKRRLNFGSLSPSKTIEVESPTAYKHQRQVSEYEAHGGSPLVRRNSPARSPVRQPSLAALHASPSCHLPRVAPCLSPTHNNQNFDKVEQAELGSVFKEIVFLERDVESAKIELSLKSDFNLADAFRLFDFRMLGTFSANEFMEAL